MYSVKKKMYSVYSVFYFFILFFFFYKYFIFIYFFFLFLSKHKYTYNIYNNKQKIQTMENKMYDEFLSSETDITDVETDITDVETDSSIETKTIKGDGNIYYERFDQHVLNTIINNEINLRPHLYFIPDRTNDPFLLSKKILSRSKNGVLKVRHKQSNNQGRQVALGGVSIANIARQIRHAICKNIYLDIDMVNAHPVILQHICNINGIKCEFLDLYVSDRESLLSEMKMDRDKAKQAYLTVINGDDDVIKYISGASLTLKKFACEIKTIKNKLISKKKKQYKLWCKYQKSKQRKKNFEGSFLNSLLCEMENEILMLMWNFFGCPSDAVLCFDGIMLDKTKKYDLNKCSNYIKETLGIDMKLKIKPMDEGFEIDNIISYDEISIEDIKGFDNMDSYVYNDFINEYSDQTKEWDSYEELQNEILPKVKRVLAYISMGKGFYLKKLDTEEHIHDMSPAKGSDINLRFKIKDDKDIKLTDFIQRNSNQLVYSTTCCKPNPKHVKKYQFNFWPGFKAKKVDTVDMNLIEPILDILKVVWANNDETVYKVLLYFFSEMLKHPERLPNKENAILLIGDQGIGKDFIVDFFEEFVIGNNLTARLTGIESAVGQFNGVLRNKVLVVVNEMASTREQFRSNFDKIKPLISNKSQMINQKGVDSYSMDNISSWLFFSNHEDVLYLEKGDRRYKPLLGNPIYKGNHKHFKSVYEKCFNNEAGNHMYTYLMNLQDEDVAHPSELKTTELKEEIRELSMTSSERFVTEILDFRSYIAAAESDEKFDELDWRLFESVSSKKLYSEYRLWCTENGERQVSNIKFGKAISRNLLKTKKRTSKGVMYIFPESN